MRLVILLPTAGKVHTKFMVSMVGLTQALQKRGVEFTIKPYEFSDLIMSRNYLVSYFLSKEIFTHALLLDSDLVFDPGQFFRLADFGEDFVAAPYADRRVTGKVLRQSVADPDAKHISSAEDVAQVLARHMKYIVTHSLGKAHNFRPEKRGDFQTVASSGTGFVLITRNVVESIVANGHARPLTRTGQLSIYADAPRFADFFSHHVTDEGDAFYGEDQSFCRRWILGCGGKVWVDRAAKVTHIGEFSFPGDYSLQSGLNAERG
ncbi:MAG: hypothetical protein ACWA40_03065 [Planktomarina sp.]